MSDLTYEQARAALAACTTPKSSEETRRQLRARMEAAKAEEEAARLKTELDD